MSFTYQHVTDIHLHCDGSGGVSGVGETDDSSVTHELGTGHEIQLAGTRMGLSRHGTNRPTRRETPASYKDCLMFLIVTSSVKQIF